MTMSGKQLFLKTQLHFELSILTGIYFHSVVTDVSTKLIKRNHNPSNEEVSGGW